MKILAMENTKYELQDFHGGGKTRPHQWHSAGGFLL
jgi:hypothetical protein